MKFISSNISPLPFYDSIALQNHRKGYAFGQVYPLIVHSNILMPFQVVLSHGTNIYRVRLHTDLIDENKYIDITPQMQDNGIRITQYSNFSILRYDGNLPVVNIGREGRYYLSIYVTGYGWIYSDVFTISNKVDDLLLLEYSNSYSFELNTGLVDFSDNFKFRCYLATQIGKPEYNFEEEASERMGYTFIESQVSKKIFRFTFLAPEYLCDALRIIRLCDNKKIVSKNQTYDASTFIMSVEWEEQGDLAVVECEFETDTVISNIGGYTPTLLGGDFNNDFNNDFNKK